MEHIWICKIFTLTMTLTGCFAEYNAKVCGKTYYTDYVGSVTSPLFPNGYRSGLDCTYHLIASGQNALTILYDTLDLSYSTSSSYDWVEIWCSPNYQSRQRIHRLGTLRAITYSHCNHALIHFSTRTQSDYYYHQRSEKGFRFSYSFQRFGVRLNNTRSTNLTEGRLEINYNGTWGTVCDDGFTDASARVACASLGYGYVGTMINNSHGSGSGPIWLDDVSCVGIERDIYECSKSDWGSHNCSHSQDVSISCVLGVRLNNTRSSNPTEGRLEIYYNGTWGTVCDDGFTNVNARVACASLGFGYIGRLIGNRHGAGTGPVWLNGVRCAGTEYGIDRCHHSDFGLHNRSHNQDVSIACNYKGCGKTKYNDTMGFLSSPEFPNLYGHNLDCIYSIKSSGQDSVTIIFPVFDLYERHSGYYGRYQYRCGTKDDRVEIKCEHGDYQNKRIYCGRNRPPALEFKSCNYVLIRFYKDLESYSIFQLTYFFKSAASEDVIFAYSGLKIRGGIGQNLACPVASRKCNSSCLSCTNGGLCCEIQNTTDQYCMCQYRYGGKLCRNEYTAWSEENYEVIENLACPVSSRKCNSSWLPCANGGLCCEIQNTIDQYCMCQYGYGGKLCRNEYTAWSEKNYEVTEKAEQSSTPWILLSVFAVSVGLSFLTVISVMIYKICKSKEDTGDNPQTIHLSNISPRADHVESNSTEKEEGYEHIQQSSSSQTPASHYESLDQIE